MPLHKKCMNPCLSRAALLLSTNSTEDGSSIPTFTLVIPVYENNQRGNKKREQSKTHTHTQTYTPTCQLKEKKRENCSHPPTTLFSGGGGMMKPWRDCLTVSFSNRPRKSL